jgi:ornithine carbamoyltransferase
MCPFQVDMETMRNAEKSNDKGVIFMHCLPAYHGLDTEVGK